MSEWITDRLPTQDDAPEGNVWVTDALGDLELYYWREVAKGMPWHPIVPLSRESRPTHRGHLQRGHAMKRYNHHGAAVSPEHPRGQWCRWDDVRKLRHVAQGMAYVLADVDKALAPDTELAQDVAKALRAWEEYDQ